MPHNPLDEIQARADAAPTLPADARMDAYYYGFDRTGVDEIDAVLSAVAIAGKGSHHTESWGDSGSAWYYAGQKGLPDAEGAAELIEETAKQSAQRLVTLKDDNRKLVAALRAVEAALAEEAAELGKTSVRLNQQVIDRHPDRDPAAAARYDAYASHAIHAAKMVRDAIREALG